MTNLEHAMAAEKGMQEYIAHMQAISDGLGMGADVAADMHSAMSGMRLVLLLIAAREEAMSQSSAEVSK